MKYISKPAIFLILSTLLLQDSYCQVQTDLSDFIKKKFLDYTTSVPREEIFLHSDREEYIAGEYLWFNIYLINRQTTENSQYSRIAYFELLNSENRPVAQKRVLLDRGTGPGQVLLPDTLSPGTYTIRVYTNWMKNFLPDNCYRKDIKIYNSLKNKPFAYRTIIENGRKNEIRIAGSGNENSAGLTLSVSNQDPDYLEINLFADKKFLTENSNRVYLVLHSGGLLCRLSPVQLVEDSTKIAVPKKELRSGINHITIINAGCKAVCEKFIYIPGKVPLTLTLTAPDSAGIRDKVSLAIENDQMVSDPITLKNLSISVSPVSDAERVLSINDYMVFGTEYGLQLLNSLKGRRIDELPLDTIDMLLSGVKSNWINWSDILSDKKPDIKYRMEKEYHQLSGHIVNSGSVTSDTSGYILMNSPGKKPGFQYTKADNDGFFSFSLDIDEGVNDLILMPDNANAGLKLIMESSFSGRYPGSIVSIDSTIKPETSYIQTLSANYQINKIYNIATSGKPALPAVKQLTPLGFYGKPDIEVVLADYISLPTMEEIFFELVPNVSLRKKKTGYEISITDRIDDNPLNLSPCLLIDGVVINDPALIADLNPEIVEKIEVIKDIYMVGDYAFPGLVNIITKAGDFSSVTPDDNMIRLKYKVIDQVLHFPEPGYSQEEKGNMRIPDFRNTLYWNPSVKYSWKGNAEITFRTSDIPADYVITIHGISSDGMPVTLKKHIRVFEN